MEVPYDEREEEDFEVFKKLAMSQPAEDIGYEKNLPQLPVEQAQCLSSGVGTLSLLLASESGPVVHRKVQRKLAPRGLRELILPRIVAAEVSTAPFVDSCCLFRLFLVKQSCYAVKRMSICMHVCRKEG